MLPAIGGYWLLTHWNLTRFRAERDSGYHLLLRSAGLGVALYLLAHILHPYAVVLAEEAQLLINIGERGPIVLTGAFAAPLLKDPPQPITGDALLSLILGLSGPVVLNAVFWRGACSRNTAKQFGDHVELLLEQALGSRTLVEVGLRSRRTYIGFVTESGVGKALEADAKLVPRYSGRRDPESLRLTLDTDYLSIIGRLRQRGRPIPIDVEFVVPLSEVVYVRPFSREVYNAIFDISERPETEGTVFSGEIEVDTKLLLTVGLFFLSLVALVLTLLAMIVRIVVG